MLLLLLQLLRHDAAPRRATTANGRRRASVGDFEWSKEEKERRKSFGVFFFRRAMSELAYKSPKDEFFSFLSLSPLSLSPHSTLFNLSPKKRKTERRGTPSSLSFSSAFFNFLFLLRARVTICDRSQQLQHSQQQQLSIPFFLSAVPRKKTENAPREKLVSSSSRRRRCFGLASRSQVGEYFQRRTHAR